jgi:serine/threonine-protein kinase RsbW
MAQRVEVAPPLHHRIRTPRGASVVLSVPAHKDYVVIIRSSVAQLAGCFGYTVRDITDLRLAVNEACALLVAGSQGTVGGAGTIECRAEVRGDVLRVTVSAAAATLTPDTDGIGWTILTALVDTLTWAQDGVSARVDLEKRPGAAHAGPALRAADWEGRRRA